MAKKKGVAKRVKGQLHSGSLLVGFLSGITLLWLFEDYEKRQTLRRQRVTAALALPANRTRPQNSRPTSADAQTCTALII